MAVRAIGQVALSALALGYPEPQGCGLPGSSVPYRYTTKFQANEGIFVRRNRRAILVSALAVGQVLTTEQSIAYTKSVQEYLRAVGEEAVSATATDAPAPRVLTSEEFAEPADQQFFKYVPARTWKYLQEGSFQFGSAEYYRRVENPNVKDWLEGLSTVQLVSGDDQVTFTIRAGFNCTIFCGTRVINGSDHERMMAQFSDGGGKCLRIRPVPDFIAHVKKRTRAFRVRLHDAIYTDAKVLTLQHPAAPRISTYLKGSPSIERVVRELFAELYEVGLIPSLYIKPTSNMHERERRIIFELRDDLTSPVVIVNDKDLLQFVEVMDSFGGKPD
jgi:hypothetical protein